MKQIQHLTLKNHAAFFTYDNGLFGKAYFVTENIIRLQLNPQNKFENEPTIMENLDVPDEGDATVATGGSGQQLKTKILLAPFNEKIFPSATTATSLQTTSYTLNFNEELARITITNDRQTEIFRQEGLPLKSTPENHLGLRLVSSPDEYFFGGGTQNGQVSLKGKKIQIENQNSWTDGGVASPVPFFFSTKGYGILANTFTKGAYSFHTPRATYLQHEDKQLDFFIILGRTPAAIIHGYQQLTGKPQLNPLYSYYPAHLNAYNRDYWVAVTKDSDGAILFPDGQYYKEYQPVKEKTFNTGYRVGTIFYDGQKLVPNVSITKEVTLVQPDEQGNPQVATQESLNGEKNNYLFSARAVIDRYQKQDLPLGWFLPNDGYGAGYGQTDSLAGNLQNLQDFGEYTRQHGVELGLWTQENLAPKNPDQPEKEDRDLAQEVKQAGVAALKTDVAWIGEGYTFGLNGVAEAYAKMTSLSAKRPFIVTLDGWAGTQRYASIWSGDQEGSDWQNIAFHIPTYLSTGLSGNPNVGGDIDGIFGGDNPIIQTRDLQWKAFTPLQLVMDGWGSKAKDLGAQFGPEFLDINRFYLKLKTTLLPYFYSLAWQARETGAPILRPTFFSEANAFTYGERLNKQFLVGEFLLVAPIYDAYRLKENGDSVQASLYLPDDLTTWYDFFTGESYRGGQMLTDFAAPLWKLPLFVKAGGILPLWNATNQPREIDHTKRRYRIYPSQTATSFTEYEDDGLTNDFETGATLETTISQVATTEKVTVKISASQGSGYPKMIKERLTTLEVFASDTPREVVVNGQTITNWTYGPQFQEKYTPANSPSTFAQQQINRGNFIVIPLLTQNIFIDSTIEIY